jgi:2'-5' RNA ligase
MRLFLGVELEEHVRAAAGGAAERLRTQLMRATPGVMVRWVAPENMHITVWFIGEVPDTRAELIAAALTSPFDLHAFDLSLAGCGVFPSSGAPRVFWIGATHGGAAMTALHSQVGARLAPVGFLPEGRGYTAHLTIGRVKDPGGAKPRELRELLHAVPADCGTSRICALTLFRSRLSPRGAAYEPLLRVPLKG